MGLLHIHPNAEGVLSDYSLDGEASKVAAVATNDGDASTVYSESDGDVQEFTFPVTAIPAGNMVMAVRLCVVARGGAVGEVIKLSCRRGLTSLYRRSSIPRESSITLTEDYATYSAIFPNRPFTTDGCPPLSHDLAWDAAGTYLAGLCWGVETVHVSSDVFVTEVYLEVIYRPTQTIDKILCGERIQLFQWAEIEGCPYVPTTQSLPGGCGDYYYGFDRRPVAGSMLVNEMFRSGRLNRAKGKEEIETARVVLLDVDGACFETGGSYRCYPQGFYTWLLAYGDKTHTHRTRMVHSSWNTLEGLDPQHSSYGKEINVVSTSGFAASGGEDSYVYCDREAIWHGDGGVTWFGNHLDATKLLRGQLSSMNSEHAWNPVTGVYPEVTDKPTCWTGRWVRIWTNAIDPETGYPFPMSTAMARTYVWASHSQEMSGGKVGYTILFSSFESLLSAKIPTLLDAHVKGLNYAGNGVTIYYKVVSGGTVYETTLLNNYTPTYYSSTKAIISALNTALKTSYFKADSPLFSIAGSGKVVFRVKPSAGLEYTLFFGWQLGKILGFKINEEIKPDDSTATTWTFTGEDSPAGVYCTRLKNYVVTDETDMWPTFGGVSGCSTDQVALYISGGSGDPVVFKAGSTLVGSDANGDYVVGASTIPKSIKPFFDYKDVYSKDGEDAPIIRPVMICTDVTMHAFFLRAATSTGFQTNGTYDYWPRGFGLGLPEFLFDRVAWRMVSEALANNIRTWFVIEPTSLLDLLEEELAYPNGIILRQDDQGRLQLAFNGIPSQNEDVPELLEENFSWRKSVREENAARNLLNHITLGIDHDPIADKFRVTLESREPNSIARYGDKSVSVKHHGIRSRDVDSSVSSAVPVLAGFPMDSNLVFERYAFEMPVIACTLGPRALALKIGDGVRVTHPLLQDVGNDSARGLVSKACEVAKLDKNDIKGEVEAELQYDGITRRFAGYAPAAVVVSWDAGTSTATVAANRFSASTDSYVDADLFSVGDVVEFFQGNAITPSRAEATVTVVSGSAITVSGTLGFTPVAGDVIKWTRYDDLVAAQIAKGYCAISDGSHVDSGDTIDTWNYAP